MIDDRDDAERNRWEGHPWAARAIRFASFIVPFLVSVASAFALSSILPAASGFAAGVVRWVAIAAASTVMLVVADKVTRRLLPLSALLGLTLVFPDQAPSRFRVAMRSGTTAQLRRRLDEARRSGTANEAAEHLLALVGSLSLHDRLTRGHSERVRAYTQMIGEEMRLGRDELDKLHWVGLLHDIGKLEVPAEILTKPGKLTDDEFETIKKHPMAGKHLAAPLLTWLGDAARGIWEHHERIDGTGYPRGIAGDEISMSARIISVADSFDVMTSVRSYKKASAASAARAELARCAGTQFDPVVVRAFLSVSLGRLRMAMGPLSWLSQASMFPQLAVAQSTGSVAAGTTALVVGAAAGTVGIAASPVAADDPDPQPEVAVEAEPFDVADAADAAHVAGDPVPGDDPEPVAEPAIVDVGPADLSRPVDRSDAVTDDRGPATTVDDAGSPTTAADESDLASTTAPAEADPPSSDPSGPTAPSVPSTEPASGPTGAATTSPPAATGSTAPTSAPSAPATTATTTTSSTTTTSTTTTTTTSTTTTSSTTTTTTIAPAVEFSAHLMGLSTEDAPSQPVLPLAEGAPPAVPLPNYDTDRDNDPGLGLVKSPDGLDSTEGDEVQRFRMPVAAGRAIDGPIDAVMWIRSHQEYPHMVEVAVGVYDCVGTSCVPIATGSRTTIAWMAFTPVSVGLDTVNHVVPAGHELEIRVAAIASGQGLGATDDLRLAFGTAEHPSAVSFGV